MRDAWRRRPVTDDTGVTLVESVISLSILLIVMGSMITMSIQSAESISRSRQRQEASTIASRAMEQLRALPYATLTAGLVAADLAGDANVATVSGLRRLRLPGSGIDEALVADGAAPSATPLFPHVSSRTSAGVTYTVATYVTHTAPTQPYTLRVLVSWISPVTDRPVSMLQSSAAYSPDGCLSLETHPYSGPCQSYTTGQAGVLGAGVMISSGTGPGAPMSGFDATSLSLGLAGVSGSMAVEQIGTTVAQAATTGAAATTTSGVVSDGQASAVASTSTDPTSGLATGDSASAVQPSPTAVGISGTVGTISALVSSADTAATWGHATSSTVCTDPLGGTLATGTPCTGGSATVAGADARVRIDLSGTSSVSPLDTFDLARFTAAPSASAAATTEVRGPGSTACPDTTADGCTYAAAVRSLGTATFGRLPDGGGDDEGPPSAFTSMVTVTGLTERSRVEAGIGERTALFERTGTLSYWNGSGYTAVDLSSPSIASTITPAPVIATYHGGGGEVAIRMTSTITVGSTTTSATGAVPCRSAQCTRTVKGSVISVRVAYVVEVDEVELTYFVVSANLGSLLTSATFSGTPSA